MTQLNQADRIRELVSEKYVRAAANAGENRFSVRVRDVLKDVEAIEGFPRGRTPLICNVLQGPKLLNQNGLEIESIDGPPSRQSTTVVVHYRRAVPPDHDPQQPVPVETSAERAQRLVGKLRGLLKAELAEYGGAEGFARWIRYDEDPRG